MGNGEKEWHEISAMFLKDGVEEMMRNASCFVVLVPCEQSHHPKQARKSTPTCSSRISLL